MAEYTVKTSNMFSALRSGQQPTPKATGSAPKTGPGKEEKNQRDRKGERRREDRRLSKERQDAPVARVGKRVYDRHSGSGRPKNEMKKEGAGRHNWGSLEAGHVEETAEEKRKPKSYPSRNEKRGGNNRQRTKRKEVESSEEARPAVTEKDTAKEANGAPADSEKDTTEEPGPKEEQPGVTKYDEYMEALKEKTVEIEKQKPRVVNEEIPSGFVKHSGKVKKAEDVEWGLAESKHTTNQATGERKKERRQKNKIDLNFRFSDQTSGRRKNGGGRGRSRADAKRQTPSKPKQGIDLDTDFPSLSGATAR